MSNLALDTRNSYSDECLSEHAAEAPSQAPAELEERRAPVALSWLLTGAASVGLWVVIANVARWLL